MNFELISKIKRYIDADNCDHNGQRIIYSDILNVGEFSSTPLEELITMRLCPAFLVPQVRRQVNQSINNGQRCFIVIFQRPLFNRCLPKITFPKAVIVSAEEENEVDQNGTLSASLSAGNNVTEPLDNLDPTFVDYEG